MDVTTINNTIRSLVEDPNGEYADDPYIQPLITLEYTDIMNEIRLYGPEIDEYTIELPAVPAGTPDLSGYSGATQPLFWLLNPREIEWKLAGTPTTNYVDAKGPLDKVIDIPVPGIQALDDWSYNHFNIALSMFSAALDLRITGEFLFQPLTTGSDVIQLGQGILPGISFRIANTIAIKRGNQQWVTNYGVRMNNSLDHFKQGLVHMRQGKNDMRVGRVQGTQRYPVWNISS